MSKPSSTVGAVAPPVSIVSTQELPPNAIRRRFGDADASLASIIERAGDDKATRHRLERQLDAIYRLGNVIHAERKLETIFSLGADCILSVTEARRCAILLLDERTGAPTEVVTRTKEGAGEARGFSVSRTIVEETCRGGVSLLSTDATRDARFDTKDSITLQMIKSVMSVPIRTDSRVIGVIYVDTSSVVEVFTESDLQLLTAVGKQIGVAIERAGLIADLEKLFVGSIRALVATIEAKDEYTHGHSERVTRYALAIAEEMHIDARGLAVIELSGLLHDVGKIGVPEAILNKNGPLTDEERLAIQRHPQRGADIVKNIEKIERVAAIDEIAQSVRHHHERYDGKGYPTALAGEAIPLAARILAVADTFDAITSDRSYRKGRDAAVGAKVILENVGTQFAPDCAAAFQRALSSGALERAKSRASRFLR
jgi:HD-GYP domain-containing protein (c-di-GMP phosphodiesterase class II)